jgi:hypothetical protein
MQHKPVPGGGLRPQTSTSASSEVRLDAVAVGRHGSALLTLAPAHLQDEAGDASAAVLAAAPGAALPTTPTAHAEALDPASPKGPAITPPESPERPAEPSPADSPEKVS